MIGFVRKNLGCLIWNHTSPFRCRLPPISFSTSIEGKKLCISPTLLELLVDKYKFSPVFASRVASDLGHFKTPENADSILSFFKESGCSNAQLVKIVEYRPRVLLCDLERSIKPKVKILQNEGFSRDDISKIISNNPKILQISVENNFIPSLSVLKGVLGSNDAVAKVLRRSPWLFKANLENILVHNVEFLKSSGVPMKHILTVLTAFPSSFVVVPEIMRKSTEKAKEMGLNASSKNFTYAVATIAIMRNDSLELKLQAFRDMGFSEGDISAMFRRAPLAFNASVEKIKKVIKVVLASGKFDMSSIVNQPISLTYSVENRVIPRLQVLEILERRKFIKTWPSLVRICTLSDGNFFNKFISPYSDEVTELCIMKPFARIKKEMK